MSQSPVASSDFFAHYSTFAADVDLIAASLDQTNGAASSASRGIIPDGAGNLSVVRARDGATVTFPVVANLLYPVQAKKILSAGTTISGALVLW